MIRQTLGVLIFVAVGLAAPGDDADALKQSIAAVKRSIAGNQARLRRYSWTESTEIRLKGDLKKVEQNECRFGPDGHLVKTPIGAGSAAKQGRKADQMNDYMDRVGSLVRRYVPPAPQSMQEAFQAGKAHLDRDSGVLAFNDYAKPGDRVTLTFDPRTRRMRKFQVATYLDEPSDAVTLNAQFANLPDGTNYLEEYVLDATGKQIRIKTANFGHTKGSGSAH